MFLEPYGKNHHSGWIEVISGCMFSGKTEELLRRLRRAEFASQSIITFKPKTDNRYGDDIISHNQNSYACEVVTQADEIRSLARDFQVIGIDEAQFFDDPIVDICNELANSGKRVIIAGLDMDYKGRPFGPMPKLLAVAEFVTKLHAICEITGEPASFTFKDSSSNTLVDVGGKGKYHARSRTAFYGHKKDQ